MEDTNDDSAEDNYPYCPDWKNGHYGVVRLGPEFHPLDAYRKFEDYKKDRITDKLLLIGGGGAIGFASASINNFFANRPAYAQIYKHFGCAIAGALLGSLFLKYAAYKESKKVTIFMHYIQLHPEDFPKISKYFNNGFCLSTAFVNSQLSHIQPY